MQKTVCEKTVNSESETVHIILTCQLIMRLIIPLKLRIHIQHGSDRQQIQSGMPAALVAAAYADDLPVALLLRKRALK